MKFTSIVRAAILFALFAAFSSQGNAAQSVSAPVLFSQSTEPTGAYYEQNGSNSCGNFGTSSGTSGLPADAEFCKIDFAAPAIGKYLVIEHVACNIVLNSNLLADVSLASASGANDVRLVPLEPTAMGQNSGFYYAVNDTVLYVTRSTPRIVLHPTAPSGSKITCQISGHLNVNQ
jgi:hypothetical protein